MEPRPPTIRFPRVPGIPAAKVTGAAGPTPDRRKAPRITIQELNQFGAEALRKRLPELQKQPDERPGIVKVLDVLDLPRNLVANAIAKISGTKTAGKQKATLGIPRVFVSDILEHLGVENRVVRAVAGFAGDIAIDPLTYYNLAATTGMKIAQWLPRILKSGRKTMQVAARTGQIGEELAKATGITRPGHLMQFIAKAKAAGKNAEKTLLSKRGGVLPEMLIRRIKKGAPEALGWMEKYGEPGRSILRAPFAEKGWPILKVGARAKKYKGIQEALTNPEKLAEYLGKIKAEKVAKAAGGAVASATKEGALELAARQANETQQVQHVAALKKQFLSLTAKYDAAVRAGKTGKKQYLQQMTGQLRAAQNKLAAAEKNLALLRELPAEDIVGRLAQRGDMLVTPEAQNVMRNVVAAGTEQPLKAQAGALTRAGQAIKGAEAEVATVGKGLRKKTILPPEAAAALTKYGLAKTELAGAKGMTAATEAKLKGLAGLAEKVAAEKAGATNELRRYVSSPEAPLMVQEQMRAAYGPRYLRGQKGILAGLGAAKRKLFGPPRSEMAQGMVAVRGQYTVGSAMRGAQAQSRLVKEFTPLVTELAANPNIAAAYPGGAKEVADTLFHLAEAGPGGRSLATLQPTDYLRQVYVKAQDAGLTTNPKVTDFLAKYGKDMEAIKPAGEVQDYAKRLMTTEAGRASGMVKTQLGMQPGRPMPGGRLQYPTAEELPRARLQIFEGEGLAPQQAVSTDVQKIKELTAAGYQKTQEFQVSAAEWNRLASAGEMPKLLGPSYEKIGQYKGPLFETDLPRAYGASYAAKERRLATEQLGKLVEPTAVNIPRQAGLEGGEQLIGGDEYAHLARPRIKPTPGSPFYELQQSGMLDRAYPVPVADMLDNAIQTANHEPSIEGLLVASDRLVGIWKTFALYHPAYLIRNVFQNLFGGLMAGANPLNVGRLTFSPELRAIRQAGQTGDLSQLKGLVIRSHGLDIPVDRVFKDGMDLHMLGGGGLTGTTMSPQFAGPLNAATAQVAAGTKGLKNVVFRGNTWFEDQMRLATWFDFMGQGMKPRDAAIRVLVAMPDLSDLTLWEREVARRVIPFYCMPTDHEILTRAGWKRYDQLTIGEEVLTYDVERDRSEWQPVTNISAFDYAGELMTLGGKTWSFEFTPSHRWPVFHHTRRGGREITGLRKVVKGYELNASHRIPQSAPHDFTEGGITPRDAALIGWIWTDGHQRLRHGKYWEAVIYQKKEQHFAGIRKLLGDDARAEYVHPQTGVVHFSMSLALSSRLAEICPSRESLPLIVTHLNESAAKAMWQAMVDAEASVNERAGTHFGQKPGGVLEAFQILTVLLNRTANIHPSRGAFNCSGCYVSKGRRWRKVAGCLGTKWYAGKVWCPTTPNGTWFVRHDGRVSITGNSWMRRNGALQIFHYLPRKPAYANMLTKLKNFAESYRLAGNVPEEFRPIWMQEQMAFQVGGDEKRGEVFLPMNWLPFEELYQAGAIPIAPGETFQRMINSMRPDVRWAFEMGTGVNIFRQEAYPKGMQITSADLVKAFPEAILGKSGTPMDTLLSTRPLREALVRIPQMPTAGGKLKRGFLGGAFQSVDLEKGQAAVAWQLRDQISRVRSGINRARQVGDDALAKKLMAEWVRLTMQLHRKGLPGVPKATEKVLQEAGT